MRRGCRPASSASSGGQRANRARDDRFTIEGVRGGALWPYAYDQACISPCSPIFLVALYPLNRLLFLIFVVLSSGGSHPNPLLTPSPRYKDMCLWAPAATSTQFSLLLPPPAATRQSPSLSSLLVLIVMCVIYSSQGMTARTELGCWDNGGRPNHRREGKEQACQCPTLFFNPDAHLTFSICLLPTSKAGHFFHSVRLIMRRG
jgi:hypothetical protein